MAGAMFEFTVALPGQQAFARAIQRFAAYIENWKPFWDDYFRDAWYRAIQSHYETQGRTTGTQWAPLSEAYAIWKQKHWPGLPIGVLSGATRESLTFQGDPNAVWEATPNSLSVGTRVPYAIYLQYGTRARAGGSVAERHLAGGRSTIHIMRGGMPARPPLRVSSQFVTLTAKLMQEYAVNTLRNSGVGGS